MLHPLLPCPLQPALHARYLLNAAQFCRLLTCSPVTGLKKIAHNKAVPVGPSQPLPVHACKIQLMMPNKSFVSYNIFILVLQHTARGQKRSQYAVI
jgi:hypothetical protein